MKVLIGATHVRIVGFTYSYTHTKKESNVDRIGAGKCSRGSVQWPHP